MTPVAQSKFFVTRIDIPEKQRAKVIDLLNMRLADTLDLKTQVKQAHWNVKGKEFFQVHELFDLIAGHVEAHIDLIAERATALGGVAHGTARQAVALSSLPEYDLNAVTCEQHLRAVSDRLAQVSNAGRAAIDEADELGDQATSDLFTQIVREMDKDLYFLESHLQA